MQSIAIIKQLRVLREEIIFNKGIRDCLLSTFTVSLVAQKNISDQSERSLSDLVVLETANCMLCMINGIKCSLTLLHLCLEMSTISTPDHFKSNLNCIPYLTLTLVLSRPLLSSIKRKLCGAFIKFAHFIMVRFWT